LRVAIQKFGGSSLANIEQVEAVADFLAQQYRRQQEHLIAVVSAMGEQTDDLLRLAHSIHSQPPKRELDMLLSVGERIAMSLLAIALHKRGIPSVSFTGSQVGIITDEEFGSARIASIMGDRVRSSLEQNLLVIVAGFQGVSRTTKNITTLGRGGTDLTAVALGIALDANRVELFKDVEGVYRIHPQFKKGLKALSHLSWRQMHLLAQCGTQVVQARAVKLAQKYQIPVIVRSSKDFTIQGTTVGKDPLMHLEGSYLGALTRQEHLSFLSCVMEPQDWHQALTIVTHLARGADCEPHMLRKTAPGRLEFALPSALAGQAKTLLSQKISNLQFHEERACVMITAVGGGFLQGDEQSEKILSCVPVDILRLQVEDDTCRVLCTAEQGQRLLGAWGAML
jgi:aspartate kinase